MRLSSTIPAFGVEAKENTLIGGKYRVKKGEPIALLLGRAHLDPVVYGDDATEFKPERMLDKNFERLQKEFPNSWKPFGNGMRACIGRPFAWQEGLIAMAMLLQNFNFTMDDPNYQLKVAESLTIKPKGFYMRAALRNGMSPTELEQKLTGRGPSKMTLPSRPSAHTSGPPTINGNKVAEASGKPIGIYYGSNSGTCEALAQRLAADAKTHGFNATVVEPLDTARENLPKNQPVVIITASYEGQPPDNAAHFVAWLESLKAQELGSVPYAVFGCGHHDWVQTFHRVPKLVDTIMEERGASRIVPMGLTDAAERDMFSDFEAWEDEVLWPALIAKYDVGGPQNGSVDSNPGLAVQVSNPRTLTLRQDVSEAVVSEERILTAVDAAQKKHMAIQLPAGMTYRAGDYLAVLPLNPRDNVERVFRRFRLSRDACLTISGDKHTPLPVNQTVSAFDVLGAYVELAQPATKRNVLSLKEATKDAETIEKLEKLAGEKYHEEITQKRMTVLGLLERFPSIELSIGAFLAMLPPMRVRQ